MSLDPELQEMRRVGHLAVDLAVEHLAALRNRRVATPPSAPELERLVAEPLPRRGLGLEPTLARFFDELLPRATLVNHPRFFAYVPGPGSFAGAIGAWVAAATNTFVGTWLGGSVMAQLELQTLAWLREAVALPDHRVGLLTTGGSMANLGGIAAGLVELPRERAVLYVGNEGHYSLAKAGRLLGLPQANIRRVASDGEQRMDVAALAESVRRDRASGLLPAVVAATAGTTNTGSIDPLPAIAALCRQEQIWLHVDAAYGAAAALVPEGALALAGWQHADSVTMDPHKWFYVPFECGCLLVRDRARLAAAFGGDADYMQDIPRREVNFFTLGPELSRGARALKLWFLLRSTGVDAIAAHVQQDLALCRLAHDLVAAEPRLEVLTPPRLSVFTFAVRAGDAAGERLVADLLRDGFLMLSSTRVRGRFAVRFCVVNHRTTADDVRESVARIRACLR